MEIIQQAHQHERYRLMAATLLLSKLQDYDGQTDIPKEYRRNKDDLSLFVYQRRRIYRKEAQKENKKGNGDCWWRDTEYFHWFLLAELHYHDRFF